MKFNQPWGEEWNQHCSRSCKNNCKGCICDRLRQLPRRTEVDIFLKGGQVIEDLVFLFFERDDCCAFFADPETASGSILVVDCQDIQALRIIYD